VDLDLKSSLACLAARRGAAVHLLTIRLGRPPQLDPGPNPSERFCAQLREWASVMANGSVQASRAPFRPQTRLVWARALPPSRPRSRRSTRGRLILPRSTRTPLRSTIVTVAND